MSFGKLAASGRRDGSSQAPVGVLAGLAAGMVYLAAASAAAALEGGTGTEPLQRIAAILLGAAVAPPDGHWSGAVALAALAIHLPLSALYGRLVDAVVAQLAHAGVSALAGAVLGALIYVLNRWLIAPALFPWFESTRSIFTALNHMLFGVVAAMACVAQRRRLGLW